jgi:iron complex transport system substrate-binding protein
MIRQFRALAVSLILALTLLTGCAPAASQGEAPPAPASKEEPTAAVDPLLTIYPVTVKDALGRDVTIAAEPKRIISVAPSNTELLFAIGKGDSLVGRSDFCDYPAAAASIESVGGFFPPNYEKIVSLQPDLVLLIGGSDEARDKLTNEFKLTTFVVDPQNIEELYVGLKALGVVVNAQAKAAEVTAQMQAGFKEITDKVAKASTKPKVFYEVWHDPLMTAGTNTFIDDLIRMAGGTNTGAAVKGWSTFSLEQLAAANPDVIVTGAVDRVDQIKDQPSWQGFSAVKEGRVIVVEDGDVIVRPGPRLVFGLRWFAEQIHPDLLK